MHKSPFRTLPYDPRLHLVLSHWSPGYAETMIQEYGNYIKVVRIYRHKIIMIEQIILDNVFR